jgi:hypothetical protein
MLSNLDSKSSKNGQLFIYADYVIRDDADDRRHIDDIHYNSVRHAYELANVLNLL